MQKCSHNNMTQKDNLFEVFCKKLFKLLKFFVRSGEFHCWTIWLIFFSLNFAFLRPSCFKLMSNIRLAKRVAIFCFKSLNYKLLCFCYRKGWLNQSSSGNRKMMPKLSFWNIRCLFHHHCLSSFCAAWFILIFRCTLNGYSLKVVHNF